MRGMKPALTLLTTVGLALVLTGCTSLFHSKSANRSDVASPPADVASTSLQALSASENNCVSAILEPERSQLLQAALAESKLQAVSAQLERRGVTMKTSEAMALKLPDGEQLLIPFGDRAHLIWTRSGGQTAALGLVRQGNQTLNISSEGSERRVRMLEGVKVQRLLTKLREKSKFREFEQKLREKGKRIAEGKLRVLVDETNHLALIGLPNEGSERIVHQLRIRLKANRDEELDDNAEPQIEATACGQATGEALASAATLQPQFEGGEGGSWGGYEGPQICTSQWGYSYSCYSTTPILKLENAPVQVGAFVGQPARGRVTIYNGGGGTLMGTATVAAPFTLISGGSFSLQPGQPQEVIVEFTPTIEGETFSTLTVRSNMPTLPTAQVSVKGVAIKIETFYQLLSSLSEAKELNTVIPTWGSQITQEVGMVGFKNLTPSQIEALVTLAKNQDWNSLMAPDQTGNPVLDWLIRFIASYLLGKGLELVTAPPEVFSMSKVMGTFGELLKALRQGVLFETNYNNYYGDGAHKDFKLFVQALEGSYTLIHRAFGATAYDAAREMIKRVLNMFNSYDNYILTTMISYFGPATVFGFAALDRMGGDSLNRVFNDLHALMKSQEGASWYNQGQRLWRDIVRSLGALAAGVVGKVGGLGATPEEGTAAWKEFRETLAALAVAGKMAEQGRHNETGKGWQIHALRAALYSPQLAVECKVDVVATTSLAYGEQGRVVLGQFFHAVSGYNKDELAALMTMVNASAGNIKRLFEALELDPASIGKIREVLSEGGKIGAVVAVHVSDVPDATGLMQTHLNLTRDCGGKCFGVVIGVDSEGIVRTITGVGKISEEEAIRLARRMGFVLLEPVPWGREAGGGGSAGSVFTPNDKHRLVNLAPRDPRYCSVCNQ